MLSPNENAYKRSHYTRYSKILVVALLEKLERTMPQTWEVSNDGILHGGAEGEAVQRQMGG